MNPQAIEAPQALQRLGDFDSLLDVRSPGEYTLDHLPRALNWWVLDDAQRAEVGTLYKQRGAFEAKRLGAALVARNIALHLEAGAAEWPRRQRVLVYCWRGGSRSAAMAHVLAQVGFAVSVVRGGYKALRAALVGELARLAGGQRLRILCGPTGCGKSRLLQALQARGAQVLDLEALAAHRGSVLGALPGVEQPSQKAFETAIWERLRGFDPARVAYAESESRKIGRLQVPGPLLEAMRASPCLLLHAGDEVRVRILREDYAGVSADLPGLQQRLRALRELRGHAVVERWCAMAARGELDALVVELLQQHYDPSYRASMERNFPGLGSAARVDIRAADAFAETAERLLRDEGAAPAGAPLAADA